jgi:hypothetical protein
MPLPSVVIVVARSPRVIPEAVGKPIIISPLWQAKSRFGTLRSWQSVLEMLVDSWVSANEGKNVLKAVSVSHGVTILTVKGRIHRHDQSHGNTQAPSDPHRDLTSVSNRILDRFHVFSIRHHRLHRIVRLQLDLWAQERWKCGTTRILDLLEWNRNLGFSHGGFRRERRSELRGAF